MITCRLQIEDGPVEDSLERWGFIFIDSDKRTAPPEKKRAVSSYAGEPGEHQDPYTVDDAFDYKVNFAVCTPNNDLDNANEKIRAFNEAIRETDPTGLKRCRTITLYNDRMRVRVTGIPEVIDLPEDFYRRQDGSREDCVEFILTLHVEDPSLCGWSLKSGEEPAPGQPPEDEA